MKRSILIYSLSGFEPDKETLVVGEAIERLGYQVVVVMDKPSKAVQQKFSCVYLNPAWSYDELLRVAQKSSVCLALVLTDFASPLVGRLNDDLGLPGPGLKAYMDVSDKINWYHLALKHNLPMPKQALITTKEEYADFDWSIPFMVKASKSTANISLHPFGYKYFDNSKQFKAFLESQNLVETFLECNRHSTLLGRYLIQERVDPVSWNNGLATLVGKKFSFHEMHTSLFYPFPHHLNYHATYGPLPISEQQQQHIDRMGRIFEGVGLKNTPLSFDIVTAKNGHVYTLDINSRAGGTFTILEPLRKSDYFCALIEALLGGSFDVPQSLRPFLRRTILLNPGMIKSVGWPTPLPDGLVVTGWDELQWPVKHERFVGRFQWPLEATVVAESVDECFQKYNEFYEALEVEYENSNSDYRLTVDKEI